MKVHANEFPVKKMSEVFKVSRSGYYKWLKNRDDRQAKKADLDKMIKTVFERSRKTYGSPRVYDALSKEHVQISKSTVARRMKALQITPKKKRKFKTTTDSKHNKVVSPNLLEQNFTVEELGKIWVSDITYIPLVQGFVYLTTVLDLGDRMGVG